VRYEKLEDGSTFKGGTAHEPNVVLRQIDLAHPACSDPLQQPVKADPSTLSGTRIELPDLERTV